MRRDERELIRQCVQGEEGGWEEFVRRMTPWAQSVVRLTLRSYGLAPQTQDVEEVVWRAFGFLFERDCRVLKQFRGDCPLERWVGRVARTETIRWVKARPRRAAQALSTDLPCDSPLPIAKLLSDERRENVRRALSKLPERERSLLEGVYFREKSYRELASEWKTSMNTLASWISRAKSRLIALLDDLHLPLL